MGVAKVLLCATRRPTSQFWLTRTAGPQSLTLGLQELFRAFGNVLKSEFLKWFVSGNSNYFKLLVFCVM